MLNPANNPTFDSQTCSSNQATSNGGCLYFYEAGSVNSQITLNIASSGTSTWNSNTANTGGAIYMYSS